MFGKMKRLEERIGVLEAEARELREEGEVVMEELYDGAGWYMGHREEIVFSSADAIEAILQHLKLRLRREKAVPSRVVTKSLENGK